MFFKSKCTLLLIICLSMVNQISAQEQKTFGNLEAILLSVKEKNYTFRNAEIQSKLADLTRKSAWGNVFNPRIPVSAQTLDNFNQQVILLPGEAFGQPGTFKEITTGQRYSSLFSIQPQFEILNLSNISQVKSSKINQQLTEVQNKINEQAIYDQINSIYFNILSFQEQIKIVEQNIGSADTIFRITQNRFNEEVGRKQDVNEAEVNLIRLQDNLEQLRFNLKIQQESLALYLENDFSPSLVESLWLYDNQAKINPKQNSLATQNATLKMQAMEQEVRTSRFQNIPTLSFVSAFNWQNLSNTSFFSNDSRWIDYSYIGLKLSMDLPTTVSKLATSKNKQYQSLILKSNAEHAIKESETKNRQLILDFEKALSQVQNFKKIADLKQDTYNKNYNQYQENILGLDKLLISHNDLLIAKLNLISALANIGFNKNKIDINNKF
jgi:outer membrane protein TolC